MLFVKIALVAIFLLILYQDLKERMVYWFLFPLVGILASYLAYQKIFWSVLVIGVLINLLVVSLFIFVLYSYTKFKLGLKLSDSTGLGDILFYIALSFTFASVSFIVIFISGMIFSLATHLIFKNKLKIKTVPVAGYLSLFFMITYVSHWLGFLPTLYIL